MQEVRLQWRLLYSQLGEEKKNSETAQIRIYELVQKDNKITSPGTALQTLELHRGVLENLKPGFH